MPILEIKEDWVKLKDVDCNSNKAISMLEVL